MKKLIAIALVMVIALLTMVGCVSVHAEADLKTPLEWAKEEIASDERYEGQHIMFSVIPIEDSTLTDNEALYFIIAITEESDLVMDWYGVHLEWEVDAEKVIRDELYIDADLFKTEIIGDDGVILDYEEVIKE
jgi:hypothetical protein